MKKYRAIVKTIQYWEKVITIKHDEDPMNDDDIAKEEADNNFYETHYENFDDSWQNALICKEEHEVIEVEKVK